MKMLTVALFVDSVESFQTSPAVARRGRWGPLVESSLQEQSDAGFAASCRGLHV